MTLPAHLGFSQGFNNVDLNCAVSCKGKACLGEWTLKWAVKIMNGDVFVKVLSIELLLYDQIFIYLPFKGVKIGCWTLSFSQGPGYVLMWRAGCFLGHHGRYSHKAAAWASRWIGCFDDCECASLAVGFFRV